MACIVLLPRLNERLLSLYRHSLNSLFFLLLYLRHAWTGIALRSPGAFDELMTFCVRCF